MNKKKSHTPKKPGKKTAKRNPASAKWTKSEAKDKKTYSKTKVGKARKRADSTPESKAKWDGRAAKAEMHDKHVHPIDQTYKSWTFDEWYGRPSGVCEGTKAKRAHRPKLSEDLAVTIGRMLTEGLYRYHVEGLLGLTDRAITNWLQRAKKHEANQKDWVKRAKRFETRAGAIESLGPKPEVTLHMKLGTIVCKAEAMGETSLYGALIMCALNGDPKTAMWILERKYPERYGRLAMRTDLEFDEAGKLKVNPIAELASALQAVAERGEE